MLLGGLTQLGFAWFVGENDHAVNIGPGKLHIELSRSTGGLGLNIHIP